MAKKILVTGASGFIGSFLCERLVEKGFGLKAFIKYNSRNFWGWLENSICKNKIEIISGDIRNYDSVRRAMKNVDTVFHLAALIGIPYSYYSPDSYVDTNIKGTLNILQAALEENVRRVIHTSTSEVYGTAQFAPMPETHPFNPQSPYAATKAGADFLALSFYRSFNLPVVIVRPFNTYGPRQSARAIIPTVIIQALSGSPEIELGATSPTRDLTYVKDIVEGFINASQSAEGSIGEIINLGSGFEISVKDLVDMITRLMNVKIKVKKTQERIRPEKSEVERLLADIGKAKKLLDWNPKCSLEDGLKKTIEWFKSNARIYKQEMYNV